MSGHLDSQARSDEVLEQPAKPDQQEESWADRPTGDDEPPPSMRPLRSSLGQSDRAAASTESPQDVPPKALDESSSGAAAQPHHSSAMQGGSSSPSKGATYPDAGADVARRQQARRLAMSLREWQQQVSQLDARYLS